MRDINRLNGYFECVALGAHLHHLGTNFKGAIKGLASFLVIEDEGGASLQKFLLARAMRDARDLPGHWENQEVLFCQVADTDQYAYFLISLCLFLIALRLFAQFSRTLQVFQATWDFEIMKRGMPVTFILGGDEYPVYIE
jgi:hypothetical protein